MYLVDSNVWLELLLEQDRADEVRAFFDRIEARFLVITEFTLYTIGIMLINRRLSHVLQQLLDDLADGRTRVVRLSLTDISEVVVVCGRLRLDFDDAYQYVAARNSGLRIVTFDSDFYRTDIERLLPSDVR